MICYASPNPSIFQNNSSSFRFLSTGILLKGTALPYISESKHSYSHDIQYSSSISSTFF